jgi:hypothetical protein
MHFGDSSLGTIQVGNGKFGAKTTELTRFKDVLERNGCVIAPHVSFSKEFFFPALVRSGILNEQGMVPEEMLRMIDSYEYSKDYDHMKPKIQFTEKEKQIIRDALSQFHGHAVAVRSDEDSAKGLGVFGTLFVLWDDDEKNMQAIEHCLVSQFFRNANMVKQNLGMGNGIGIQVMPVTAMLVTAERQSKGYYENFRMVKYNLFSPPSKNKQFLHTPISIAGFTARKKNDIIFHFSYGIGGAVNVTGQ